MFVQLQYFLILEISPLFADLRNAVARQKNDQVNASTHAQMERATVQKNCFFFIYDAVNKSVTIAVVGNVYLRIPFELASRAFTNSLCIFING